MQDRQSLHPSCHALPLQLPVERRCWHPNACGGHEAWPHPNVYSEEGVPEQTECLRSTSLEGGSLENMLV